MLKEEIGSSILGCEISSLLDKKLARWSTASCALAYACRLSISEKLFVVVSHVFLLKGNYSGSLTHLTNCNYDWI